MSSSVSGVSIGGNSLVPISADSYPTRAHFKPSKFLKDLAAIGIDVLLRQIAFVGASQHCSQFLQREEVRVERINKRVHGFFNVALLNVVVALREDGAFFSARENGFNVTAGQWTSTEVLANIALDSVALRNFFHAGNGCEKFRHIIWPLGREERHAKAEAALAFHINREQVRTRGHRNPELATAEGGIANVRRERREDPARNAAISICLAIAKNSVGFVHDHDHRPQRTNCHEDAGLLPLRIANPFRAEFAHFHDREATFAGETIYQE